MKKILYYFLLAVTIVFTACGDDLPEANFNLHEVGSLTSVVGDEKITISWADMENSSPTEYYIKWVAGTVGVDSGEATVEGSVKTYEITDLVNDVAYDISVQPRYAQGLAGVVSVSVKPVTSRFPVTNLLISTGSEKVKINWGKPEATGFTGYRIEYTPGDVTINVTDADAVSQVVEELTNDTEYTFSITCIYPQGDSEVVTATSTPGIVDPVIVAETEIMKGGSATFGYNEMFFKEDIKSVSWNFGDESALSTEIAPTHTFAKGGIFNVVVTVTYNDNTTDTGSVEMKVIWTSLEILNVKCSSPVFSPDGKVMYLPSSDNDNAMFAIDIVSGDIKWKTVIPQSYGGGALVHPTTGVVYMATRKDDANSGEVGRVFALNPEDGTIKWTYDNGLSKIESFPALYDDKLYIITSVSCKLISLDAESGTANWTIDVAGNVGSAVAVTNTGNIIVGTDTQIAAFSPAAGAQLWSTAGINVTERGSFAFGNANKLYATLKEEDAKYGGLVQIDVATGTLDWTYEVAEAKSDEPGFDSEDCYYPIVDNAGNIYFSAKNIATYSISPVGAKRWAREPRKKPASASDETIIYAGLSIGADNIVYGGVTNNAGRIYGFNASSGAEVFSKDIVIPDASSSAGRIMAGVSIGPDGRLYSGTTGGFAIAVDLENNTSPQANAWSMRGGNLQGTSRQK